MKDGRWRVVYELAEPTTAIHFMRVPNDWRAKRWTPADPVFAIAHQDGASIIRRMDGKPFRKVSFYIAPRYLPLPKDYARFSPFTDGGLLIHTGQFHACAEDADCDEAEWRSTASRSTPRQALAPSAITMTAAFSFISPSTPKSGRARRRLRA